MEESSPIAWTTSLLQITLVLLSLFVASVAFSILLAIIGVADPSFSQLGTWFSVLLAAYFLRPRSFLSFFGGERSLRMQIAAGSLLGIGLALLYFAGARLLCQFGLESPYQQHVVEYVQQGPIQFALFVIFANWLCAAVVEELIFRGFILSRLTGGRFGVAIPILIQALIFGVVHLPAGLSSAILACVLGLILGIAFMSFNKNLTAPIIAHGVANTIIIAGLVVAQTSG